MARVSERAGRRGVSTGLDAWEASEVGLTNKRKSEEDLDDLPVKSQSNSFQDLMSSKDPVELAYCPVGKLKSKTTQLSFGFRMYRSGGNES